MSLIEASAWSSVQPSNAILNLRGSTGGERMRRK
jgi:hypothetical protein